MASPTPRQLASTTTTSSDVPRTSKSFVPLENNPEVMTTLAHNLGLSPSLSFHDVFSIDDTELLAFVPRPAVALLLVFPVSEVYERERIREDGERERGRGDEELASRGQNEVGGDGTAEGMDPLWWRQTIRNSCGLMGVLHAVANGGAREQIVPNSPLADLVTQSLPLAPKARAQLLYDSPTLESLHGTAAQQGQSNAPNANDDIDLHYVCFVKSLKTNHLFELDGRRNGPLDRGLLEHDEDVLCERALDLGPRRFMRREKEVGEMRFSLVCLAPSMD